MSNSAKCFLCKSEIGWDEKRLPRLGRIYCSQECLENKRREEK